MRRRDLLALSAAAVAIFLGPCIAAAQRVGRHTIGVLLADSQSERALRLFREALQELGYLDGHNIHLEIRSADGDYGRLPDLAAELVRHKVDIVVAFSTPAALASKHATATIPIVIVAADPVANSIVGGLSQPGGNVTGISTVNAELASKQVEFLREVVPGLSRIAVLLDAGDAFARPLLEGIERSGKAQRTEIMAIHVRSGPELEAAFPAIIGNKAEAVIVQGSLPARHAADLAIRHRLPAAAPRKVFALNGGLMAYSPNGAVMLRSAAAQIDKILKGAKPADLPVKQPTRFELTINLNTAKALGLTVPQSLLARADEVIE